MSNNPSAENDAVPPPLTDEEAEVARRYFAGEVTIEELSPIIEAQVQSMIGRALPPGKTT